MGINAGEYKSYVGLDNLVIAAVTVDSAAAYTAGTPATLAPAATLSAAPNQSFATQYADDGAYDTIASEGETVLDLEVTGIPLETLALISGKTFDSTTGRLYDDSGTPGYFALGFRSLKMSGGYRYFWFLKGRFDLPSDEMVTKGETAEPKVQKLKYSAIRTTHQFTVSAGVDRTVKRVVGDDDTDSFDETDFFVQVQVPGVQAVAALALSASDPADNAAGVAVNKTCTLTFNNALSDDAIHNVVIVKADGTVPASVITIDAAKKIVTINPNPDLAGGSTYIITYAVTDIYGQTLAGAINFGTT